MRNKFNKKWTCLKPLPLPIEILKRNWLRALITAAVLFFLGGTGGLYIADFNTDMSKQTLQGVDQDRLDALLVDELDRAFLESGALSVAVGLAAWSIIYLIRR
jgi:hypothetical protein